MRRASTIILTAVLLLTFAACGSEPAVSGGSETTAASATTTASSATTTAATTAETTVATTVEEARAKGFVIVTDYLPADGVTDVADMLQQLIYDNPNSTLYFPDGVYLLGSTIRTPAEPTESVDLQLSNYAVIKAADGWDKTKAMIRLGAKSPANNTHIPGSNYSLTGGIIDGNGLAIAICIEGGRETAIRDVSIKNAVIGIHIAWGANNGSSDADISGVNIIGTGGTDSIGILVEGYDNTITNIRIGNVYTGVLLRSQGNILRNIHPLYYSKDSDNGENSDYRSSCAFLDEAGNNWYDVCYSDQFAIGFRNTSNNPCVYDSCFIMWYSATGNSQTGFVFDRQFKAIINNPRIAFHYDCTSNTVIRVGEEGGNGVIENLLTDVNVLTDDTYKLYLDGVISW